jgi:hypothetical protein
MKKSNQLAECIFVIIPYLCFSSSLLGLCLLTIYIKFIKQKQKIKHLMIFYKNCKLVVIIFLFALFCCCCFEYTSCVHKSIISSFKHVRYTKNKKIKVKNFSQLKAHFYV